MKEELIKSLKEQLEMVIKENQRLLEKHFEQDSKIVYLSADYNRYKEENKDLQARIDKAIENIKNYKDNYFVRYDDNVYKLCDETLDILNGSDDNE